MRPNDQQSVRAFAPATIGNIGPGLDILGLAIDGIGDTVRATRQREPGVVIADAGHPELPLEAHRHTSGIAAREVLRLAGADDVGVVLHVEKGLPLSGGQGGSAASAVAAAVAVNALLGDPLDTAALLAACLTAESAVAGRHLDNIAPSLLGGCVLVRSVDEGDVVRIDTPSALRLVIVHPHQRMRTSEARTVLPATIARDVFVVQAAQVAAMVAAFMSDDLDLLARSVHDVIAEPARAPLLWGFTDAKAAALDAGAIGCSISGSGPTAFAFARDDGHGQRIAAAMKAAYRAHGVACDILVTRVDTVGARIVA